jgi:integrase
MQFTLKPETVEILSRISHPIQELIFEWDRGPQNLFYHYKKILKAAGLPHDRAHMFHCMRKSVATHYEVAGGNATALLGHSSRAITLRYIDPTIAQVKPASVLLFELDAEGGAA